MTIQEQATVPSSAQPLRLGVPIERGEKGQRRLSAHFGCAEQVLLIEKRSGDTAVIENGSQECRQGGCGPVDVFISFGVDAVICQNLGSGALARLSDASIKVYRAAGDSVEAALEDFVAGKLTTFTPDDVCHAHQHGHEHEHTPCGHEPKHC